jgi:phage shock protein PspC (stress-responsive transcriptional regulator)
MSEQTTTTATPPDPPPRKRLERSADDRMLFGVTGGIAKYLGVDATIVRIVTVALTVLGGVGVLLYVAGLLLMPEPGGTAVIAGGEGREGRGQAVRVAGLVVLALLTFAVIAGIGTVIGWILFPLAFLIAAGAMAWWIASGERPAGSPGHILKRAGLGIALLAACFALALGGAWAAGTGSGAVGAALVIAAGVVLVAAAFTRPARWLILPALSLGLAAGFVTATGIELDGGIGEREHRPTAAADVREHYELGIGELVVDLREADLPAGDRRIDVELGIGHAVVLVREDVCVTTEARVGMGAVDAFDSESDGIDVNHEDARSAPAGTPRVVLSGDVGVGMLDVHHIALPGRDHGRDRDGTWNDFDAGGNDACVGGAARAGSPIGG